MPEFSFSGGSRSCTGPYCGRCFLPIPDADAKLEIANTISDRLGLLKPGDIMRLWSQPQFIGYGLTHLAEKVGIDIRLLERIITYQTLQSPNVDRRLRDALPTVVLRRSRRD